MQMNTAIPFSGVQPDFVNALAMGQQAAMQRNEASRINALAGLYQTQGADILAGNQNALNALAGIDPMAALGVADARQGMDARALQMDATRQDMRQQAEAWAATLDDRERAQRLAEGQAFLGQLVAVDGNPQAFDALMIQTGKPELVGQYNMLPQLINNMRDPLDALAMYDQRNAARQEVKADSKAPPDPDQYRNVDGVGLVNLAAPGGPAVVDLPRQPQQPDPQSTVGRIMADYRAGLIGKDQAQAMIAAETAQDGMALTMNPDGTVTYQEGAAVRPMPEGQSQNTIFATRARAALIDLESGNPDALTSYGQQFLEAVPMNAGRLFQSAEFQEAQNAGTRFLQAILRKDTGAAITAEEQREYGSVYLPQPGDTPEMAEVRRQARNQALLALENGMSAEAMLARDRALVALGIDSPGGTPIEGAPEDKKQPIDFTAIPRDELLQMDVLNMSLAEINAWNAAIDATEGQ